MHTTWRAVDYTRTLPAYFILTATWGCPVTLSQVSITSTSSLVQLIWAPHAMVHYSKGPCTSWQAFYWNGTVIAVCEVVGWVEAGGCSLLIMSHDEGD
jgi:hypothetical protein